MSKKALKKACIAATKKKDNAGFHIMYNLMYQVFTIKEMAESRGTGVGRAHPGEENKPVLDHQKIGVLKRKLESILRISFPRLFLTSHPVQPLHLHCNLLGTKDFFIYFEHL